MRDVTCALVFLAGFCVVTPQARAENWEVVWKDSAQTLRIDRDSVRTDGETVEYWYSDEVDALVDFMEHRCQAVSDRRNNRMRIVQVLDPATGETWPAKESEWKEMPYDPDNPLWVMHDQVCRDYGGR